METETIDKLFLELSQITTAKTAREIALEDAIKGALRISDLWTPKAHISFDDTGANGALVLMHATFENLIKD